MESIKFVPMPKATIVVVDRCADGEPDYAVLARTRCIGCKLWCWLGSETYELVNSGTAAPLCLVCAAIHTDTLRGKRIGHVEDKT